MALLKRDFGSQYGTGMLEALLVARNSDLLAVRARIHSIIPGNRGEWGPERNIDDLMGTRYDTGIPERYSVRGSGKSTLGKGPWEGPLGTLLLGDFRVEQSL